MMAPTLSNPRSWQLPAAAVFATMASAIGLSRLIHPGGWVAIVLLAAVLLAGVGMGLRRLNVARALILPAQLVVVLCALCATLVPHAAIAAASCPVPARSAPSRTSTTRAASTSSASPRPRRRPLASGCLWR